MIIENAQRYELFYSTGGHGGPYRGLGNALASAINIALGMPNEIAVELHPYMRDFSPVESLQVLLLDMRIRWRDVSTRT